MTPDPPAESSPALLALHAVRLKGMADDDQVAVRFGLDPAAAVEHLLDFEAFGWISRAEFAGTGGWTLTNRGRVENERQLATELASAGAAPAVRTSYEEFQRHNDRLMRACTDWQLRPGGEGRLVDNDHGDSQWDRRVLVELRILGGELQALAAAPAQRLSRFAGYDDRYAAAFSRAERGELSWVSEPGTDSCHTVWMELHEDLIATLGERR